MSSQARVRKDRAVLKGQGKLSLVCEFAFVVFEVKQKKIARTKRSLFRYSRTGASALGQGRFQQLASAEHLAAVNGEGTSCPHHEVPGAGCCVLHGGLSRRTPGTSCYILGNTVTLS